ncbi:uncharacterized protein BJ171DRAFT_579788 [Polychytrium aggregatum]|uniref:uncharacterized protein n=1 Tax=Polychytrium aggregatum TaxID=110093 RepID=UPI0022FE3143|nr:uncharacterized protein BJ171DRAFT_579788 [Polychytrium aggregatum]KAI9206279.1 hypothetical protein BJ171DRAFT_579788 [Polychytrium aggregatum]
MSAASDSLPRATSSPAAGSSANTNTIQRDKNGFFQVPAVADPASNPLSPKLGAVADPTAADTTAFPSSVVDESIIVPDFIRALSSILEADQSPSPLPEDFISVDGLKAWSHSVNRPLQAVLCDFLKSRFIEAKKPSSARDRQISISLVFKVLEGRSLIAKAGKTRDPYCIISYGHLPDGDSSSNDLKKPQKGRETFQTDVQKSTVSPVWNEHLTVTAKDLTSKIVVQVWDKKKDYFLGQVKLSMLELITACAKDGFVSKWFPLHSRNFKKDKDKYIGGEVFLECNLAEQESIENITTIVSGDPTLYLQSQLVACKVRYKSLYKILLRNALILDMQTLQANHQITEATIELLTDESRALLTTMGRQWAVGEAFQVIAYLELLFLRYKSYEIPTSALLHAYETLYDSMKRKEAWLTPSDRPDLEQLLEDMHSYYLTQITKYKEFYPKNQPRGALETTILMLRMIHKNAIYRELHPGLPESFRDELRGIMTEAAIARYHKMEELTRPFDESDIHSVVESITKLAEMLSEEIEADARYFTKPFHRELDIVRLTAETYLKFFMLTLESHVEEIESDNSVQHAAKSVFALYKRLKAMDVRFVALAPKLKKLSKNASFDIERWFAPFVHRWLLNLNERTQEWVSNSVKSDTFEPIQQPPVSLSINSSNDSLNSEVPVPKPMTHSFSVTDLFSAMYQELEFINDLEWTNIEQRSLFFQSFARTVHDAIEQYCDAVVLGEIKADQKGFASQFLGKIVGPKDIANESCVKLCNIEYALAKLEDMYELICVPDLTQTLKSHRQSVFAERGKIHPNRNIGDTLMGAFYIQVSYAENLRPCNKNGFSNPYLVIRVPDGTRVPSTIIDEVISNSHNRHSLANHQRLSFQLENSGGPAAQYPPPLSKTAVLFDEHGKAIVANGEKQNKASGSNEKILVGVDCELCRTRTINDTLNPGWDEAFQVMLPPTQVLEVMVVSENFLTVDEIIGKSTVSLDRSSTLRKQLADHQTHDVYVELEPQGRVLIRVTLEGEDEDVDFWFRKSRERLVRTRDDVVRVLTARITPYVRQVLTKAIKDHEAAAIPAKTFMSSLTEKKQYSNVTGTGISIDQVITTSEADAALSPLTDYLNKNLATLCSGLSAAMAQDVIRRTWDETLSIFEHLLVPPLFGQIEKDRKVLNRRQISIISWSISILKDFFFADAEGLPLPVLETTKYEDIMLLCKVYNHDLEALKTECESRFLKGDGLECLLRLCRFKIEREEGQDRDDGRVWMDVQLVKRREMKQ